MKELLKKIKQEKGRKRLIQLDAEFHDLINYSTKNHALAETLKRLRNQIGRLWFFAKENNSYLIDYHLTPVTGMPWSPWYKGEQMWAETSVHHTAQLLRQVYENQNEAKQKGLKLQKFIKDNLSYEIIGNKIIKEIEML